MDRTANILVVDDNSSLSRSMSLVLERKGYTVTMARDGPEAIQRVRERPFDILFIDIKMPGLNGVQTHKWIKKIRPETVAMMMTAYAVEELVKEALRNCAYTCLSKPLDMDQVLSLVEEICDLEPEHPVMMKKKWMSRRAS